MKDINVLYKKLEMARNILDMTQLDISRAIGWNQNDVSTLEAGRKKFIPTKYLSFLAMKGINLNDLFDDSVIPEQFRQSRRGACQKCREKDEKINLLNDLIVNMQIENHKKEREARNG